MELVLKIVLAAGITGAVGWVIFSLAAGVIVYLSSLTTDHVSFEPKKMNGAGSNSLIQAHTKDRMVMDPLNAAKDRWYANQDKHLFTALSVRSSDGLQLSSFYWAAAATDADKTVVLVHGMYDSAAGMAYLAEEYHGRGWNVLSINQRSHGESEGTKRTMGVRESSDIRLWVDELVNRFGARNIWLHGVSMGGAAVLMYGGLANKIPSQIKGIIADSSYSSYKTTFFRLLRLAVGSRLLAHSIIRGTSAASLFFSGVPFSSMNPQKALERISLPVLLFHGQQDVLVPVGQVRKMLNDAVKRGAVTVVIPGAPHIGAYFYAPTLYMEKIEEFCRRNT